MNAVEALKLYIDYKYYYIFYNQWKYPDPLINKLVLIDTFNKRHIYGGGGAIQ